MNNDAKTTVKEEQLVVFELDKEEFGVPILEVKEIVKNIEITPVPDSPPFILGVINLRGKIAPVMDMEKRFDLVRENKVVAEHIIMYEDETGALFGIQVDRVVGVLKVESESIKPTPKVVTSKVAGDYIKGVVVIDERVVLILDLPKILNKETVEIKTK